MKGYKSENIRNVALVGHGGSGKTTFLEAALSADLAKLKTEIQFPTTTKWKSKKVILSVLRSYL